MASREFLALNVLFSCDTELNELPSPCVEPAMKRFSLFIAAIFVFFTVAARAEEELSFDFFYDQLAPYGQWEEVADYGYVWHPSEVAEDWAPYTDGYWTYTDAGWTWVSYEDFGGIVYHYGRWVQVDELGWCWVPDYEWGPAWVSWRKNDDYVGWAPLPPEAAWEPDTGIGLTVDTDFDIGPLNYHFCRVRDFGAPVIREVCLPRERNVTICYETANITNICYRPDYGCVFSGGFDYGWIAPRCVRPLPIFRLVRNTTNIFIVGNRGNIFINAPRGNALIVAAPRLAVRADFRRPSREIHVARVVAKPVFRRGWAGLDREGVRDRLLVKMREEHKDVAVRKAPAQPVKATQVSILPTQVNLAAASQAKTPGRRNGAVARVGASIPVDPESVENPAHVRGDRNGDGKPDRISRVPGDRNGDGKPDRVVPVPGDRNGDGKPDRVVPVPGDLNGDGKPDRVVPVPGDRNGDGKPDRVLPVPGDRNGDGKPDRVVPVPGDRNGDGKPDRVVPVPGDRNGDGKPDRVIPVPGDRNGDGKPDRVVPVPMDRNNGGKPDRVRPVPGDRNGDGKPDRTAADAAAEAARKQQELQRERDAAIHERAADSQKQEAMRERAAAAAREKAAAAQHQQADAQRERAVEAQRQQQQQQEAMKQRAAAAAQERAADAQRQQAAAAEARQRAAAAAQERAAEGQRQQAAAAEARQRAAEAAKAQAEAAARAQQNNQKDKDKDDDSRDPRKRR